MRAIMVLFMAVIGAGIAATPAWSQDSAESQSAKATAVAVVNALTNKNFSEIVARFTPDMARDLPAATLEKVWSGIIGQAGAVVEVKEARSGRRRAARAPPSW